MYSDPKGAPVLLAGQSYLRVVFHGTSAVCPKPLHQTYTGPTVLTPYYPELLTVSAAGDFEGVLSFGIGLAAQGGYHVFTLTSPDRLVIDVSHVALGKFPGIWDITSWPQYWATQYSWLNGHQPWLSSPSFVVQVWAGGYGSASVVRQVSANTFKVTSLTARRSRSPASARSAFPARGSSPRSRRPSGTGFCPCRAPEAASRSFSCPHALAFVQPCSGR